MQLARELGLPLSHTPAQEVVNLCVGKIANWLEDSPDVQTIAALEALVCEKLQLVFEEFWSDEELEAIIQKYTALGEYVFATLRDDFDESTFATLIERRKVASDARDRYVAVIDCRGSKAARRFFTRWHEIAHLLTTPPQSKVLFHRSTTERCPIEDLMDEIAGVIGFYDPIFQPALLQHDEFSFMAVETIRNQFCPDASFQATLIACVTRVQQPALYIEVGMGYKKSEEEQLNSKQMALFPVESPQAKLRVLVVAPNEAAKKNGIRVDRNMQVPAESVLSSLFFTTPIGRLSLDAKAQENLGIWRHSNGTSLANIDVNVEARRLGDRVMGLILPQLCI